MKTTVSMLAVLLMLVVHPLAYAGKVKTDYPTVSQKVVTLSPDQFEVTMDVNVPCRADISMVQFDINVAGQDCLCLFCQADGSDHCACLGSPDSFSTKATKQSSSFSCTVTVPPGGISTYIGNFYMHKVDGSVEVWSFPRLDGEVKVEPLF